MVLVGSSQTYEGRVEVCINETISTICNTGWSMDDANVVCRQLGFRDSGEFDCSKITKKLKGQ